jgi:hypothetical protein
MCRVKAGLPAPAHWVAPKIPDSSNEGEFFFMFIFFFLTIVIIIVIPFP